MIKPWSIYQKQQKKNKKKNNEKKKKKQRGKSFPIGLLASVGVPIFSELAKPIAKKIFGCGKKTRQRK